MAKAVPGALTPYERGFLLGLLIGEGSFGGDGRAPQVVIHMHARHEPLLRWVHGLLPGGRLYGPYVDRHDDPAPRQKLSYRLVFRGAYLRQVVAPLLYRLPWRKVDPHSYGRFVAMLERYDMWDVVRSQSSTGNVDLLSPPPRYRTLRELLDASPPYSPLTAAALRNASRTPSESGEPGSMRSGCH